MKLIFLILSVAAFFNVGVVSHALAQGYSLWPKRPPEIEQARSLVRAGKGEEAVAVLQPFVKQPGVVGREARKITAAVQVPIYLSRRNPQATIYVVKSGDTLGRIAGTTHCPSEMIMLLNGIVDPSALRAGQKLAVLQMNLRAEVNLHTREVTVWNDNTLVACYDMVSHSIPAAKENVAVSVESRDGMIADSALVKHSTQFLSSQRALKLVGGIRITSDSQASAPAICLSSADVNELALLLNTGARVDIIHTAIH